MKKKEVLLTCELTGVEFTAPSRRNKHHPLIAMWKTKCYQLGWKRQFEEAIKYGNQQGFTDINQFTRVLGKACTNQPYKEEDTPVAKAG